MHFSARYREQAYSLVTVALLICAMLGLAVLFSGPVKIRLAAALAGTLLVAAGARLSGNPRLFCLWGLGFSIPFLFAKTVGPVINKGGGEVAVNIDVTDVFLFAFGLILARDLYAGRRAGIRVPKIAFAWMAVMAMGVFTIIAGPFRTTAVHELFRMAKMLVLFLVLVQELDSPRRIIHWCGALTSGLLVNSLVGFAEYHYHTTFGLADLGEASKDVIETLAATSVHGDEVWRVGAFLLHPNVFGAFLAALLPLTVACFLVGEGKLRKLYFIVAFLLGTGALILTNSRSGWISFSVAFICFMATAAGHRALRQRLVAAGALIALMVVGIGFVARAQITERIFQSKPEALSFRTVFEGDAKRMIAEKPIWGFGLNSYVLNLPPFARYQYGSWPPPVHQIYYLWWAETGLVGLLLHLTVMGGAAWKGVQNFRVRDRRMFAINAACLFGIVAFALDGFVSFSLRLTPTLKTFWTLAAVIMAIHYWRMRHERVVVARAYVPARGEFLPALPVTSN